jgi:hypothetical protein
VPGHMTKTSTLPENSATFYLPYYCPSAQDTRFKESQKVSRPADKDSRYSEYFKDAGDTILARIMITVIVINKIIKKNQIVFFSTNT